MKIFSLFYFLIVFSFVFPVPVLDAQNKDAPQAAQAEQAARADALLNEGSSLYYRGDYQGALIRIEQARTIDESLGENRLVNLGFDYGWIGEIYRVTGNYPQALGQFGKAIEILNAAGEELTASIYEGNTGWVYLQVEDYKNARTFLEKAFQVALSYIPGTGVDPNNPAPGMYASLWAGHLAELHGLLEDTGAMIQYNETALQYASALQMENQIYITTNNLARTYFNLYHYKRAAEYGEVALESARRIESGTAPGPGKEIEARKLLGQIYNTWSRYEEAVFHYRKVLELTRSRNEAGGSPRGFSLEDAYNLLGKSYSDWGRYAEALEQFNLALEVSESEGDEAGIATSYNNIGSVYHRRGDYTDALSYYKKAFAIDSELENIQDVAIELNNIASVYESWGEYDRAVSHYEQALSFARENEWPEDEATYLNNIGLVYLSWGKYDTAEEYFTDALRIAERLERPEMIARYIGNIGLLKLEMELYEEAYDYLHRTVVIEEEIGNQSHIAVTYTNLGAVVHEWGRFDESIALYEKALRIAETLGEKGRRATIRNNIAKVYHEQGEVGKAIRLYEEAIPLAEETGEKDTIATLYSNLGSALYEKGDYWAAVPQFLNTIEILEELRLTAPGEIRRDYLGSQIHNYQWLASTYFRTDQLSEAVDIIEKSRSKYLLEQLGRTLQASLGFKGIHTFMDRIKPGARMVLFSNSSWPDPLRFTISNDSIQGAELPKKEFVHDVFATYEKDIRRRTDFDLDSAVDDQFRTAPAGGKSTGASITLNTKFEAVIEYYRYLLAKPILLQKEKEALDAIGRLLYLYLFGSMEEVLEGVTNLTIIPDGILALVPFETLIMPDGRYLVEAYTITYVQSLSVSETIALRSHGKRDRSLLAFGGAVYNPISYRKDMEVSREQLDRLEQRIAETVEAGESLRSTYGALGYGNWTNLPGSLAEVEAIKTIVAGSDIVSGTAASEETVKRFSGTGKLREYRVIHFAVHGLLVPEVPSLSALVLSLEDRNGDGEDGFLSVKEISKLDVAADFVNLSACETGLGKIYGGEGVVGLTQAFLVAGANGLSVSLWQVSDVATTEFMAGVYSLVENRGLSYPEAITSMKRKFIKDRRRAAPFFWAPFVYYGE